MKYLSLLLIVLSMFLSWKWINSSRPIAEDVHAGIQQDLKRIISEYIQQNLPSSKNLRFEKFWTESVDKNKVKASFLYSFEDSGTETGEARVQIDGYAILNRKDKSDQEEDFDIWSFDELFILNNQVEFKEPLQIKSATDKAPEQEKESVNQ